MSASRISNDRNGDFAGVCVTPEKAGSYTPGIVFLQIQRDLWSANKSLSASQARELAAILTAAADEIDPIITQAAA